MNFTSPFALALWAITILCVLGLPIGHAMIAGSILYLYLAGLDMGTAAEQLLNGLFSSYVLLAVPLFLFAAELMNVGSMSERLLKFCNAAVGRFRGGLGHVAVLQGVIFAGISGSAIADVAGIGRIVIKMMTTNGRYPASYAAAITAAAAVIAPIIPPSIPMVLFALVSDASIGYLFLGGVVPGLMIGVGLMIVNAAVSRRRNFPVEEAPPAREWPSIIIGAFPALMIPVILLLGIRAGVMTPTEAAAVAAVYAYLISLFLYRSISVRDTYQAILASARSTASIGMLIAGALVFNYVVTVENIPQTVSNILSTYNLSQATFLLAVNLILLVLGCLLEGSTILLVIVPIFIPAAKALGIDLVHFGVVVVFNTMVGLITPPYGLLLFIVSNIARVPLKEIVLQEIPFILIMLVALAVITFMPETVLWLPRLSGYKG
jgi:tripartite ATP-independent transporter DctM subunit